MSWGFLALNNAGQVLVSSETRNLHFVGKATLNRVIKQFDGYGGLRQWAFWIDCEVTPVPFFSMPTEDYYGVVAVRQISVYSDRKTWEIEVIRSGTSSTIPEIFVFSDPRGASASGTNYGMQVLLDDGTPSFDSRLNPLVITGGANVAPPSNPLISGPGWLTAKNCEGDSSTTMGPDNHNTYTLNAPGSKPIFFYPSIAQAEREFAFHEYEDACDGFNAYGSCIGVSRAHDWDSSYWAFYRSGIRYVGGYLFCGWVTAEFGCNWKYRRKTTLIGIGIGGDSGRGGVWPYSNETLNLTPTAVIAANGARYD